MPTTKHMVAVAQDIPLMLLAGVRGTGTIRQLLPFQVSAMRPCLTVWSALGPRWPMAWQRTGLTQETKSSQLLRVLRRAGGAVRCQPWPFQVCAIGRWVPSVPMLMPTATQKLAVGQDTSRKRLIVLVVSSGGTAWIDQGGAAARTPARAAPAPAAALVVAAARPAASSTAAAARARRVRRVTGHLQGGWRHHKPRSQPGLRFRGGRAGPGRRGTFAISRGPPQTGCPPAACCSPPRCIWWAWCRTRRSAGRPPSRAAPGPPRTSAARSSARSAA